MQLMTPDTRKENISTYNFPKKINYVFPMELTAVSPCWSAAK
jgi:hypothetical protein